MKYTNNRIKVFVSKESGFVTYKSDKIAMCLNYKGHQILKKSMLDPRLIGCVPIWISYKDKPLIPAPPYTHGFTISGPNSIPFSKTLGAIYDFNYKWYRNLAYSAGFLSYLTKKNNLSILQGAEKIKHQIVDNKLILNFYCPIWKINMEWYLVFIMSSIAYLRKRLNKSNSISLITKTPYYCSRSMIIDRKFIYIKDKYIGLDNNLRFIPFTFRTFDDVQIETHGMFFKILNTNGTSFIITKSPNENIRLKKNLFSSTGRVKLWEIKNKRRNNNGEYESDHFLIPESAKNMDYENTINNLKIEYANIVDEFNKDIINE